MERIVQYVIVRGDLSKSLQWPLGAVIAQCCHATTAICNETVNDTETKEYFNDMDNMHKVVLEVILIFLYSYLIELTISKQTFPFTSTYPGQ